MDRLDQTAALRTRVARRDLLKGSFVKIAGPSSVEILGGAGFDFIVIDQEHGVFDRMATDLAILAARASAMAAVVRVPALHSEAIGASLDSGATGILAPHITSAAEARALVAACRYRGGSRGFSGMTRTGSYGANPMWRQIDKADADVAAIAMIEDPRALDAIDGIVAVEGLDGVFIGRGDLTVAFGAPTRDDPRVIAAVDTIIRAAGEAGKAIWMMADSAADVESFLARGATSFVVSSDQALLRKASIAVASEVDAVLRGRGRP